MRAVLGLSGGVDSAAAALELKRDHEVIGVFLSREKGDEKDAVLAARELGIPLEVIPIWDKMEELVCAPFRKAYLSGKTPNPCVVCNREVKLKTLFEAADASGAEKVATGHYAVIREGGLYAARHKDQSYMLARIKKEWLPRLVFPLGDRKKEEIREIARKTGVSAFDKPDSMDICFIPSGDHAAYIAEHEKCPPPGDFVSPSGEKLGTHGGIHRYTVGQRRGMGVSAGSRLYVSAIDAGNNRVVLSPERPESREFRIREAYSLADVPEVFSCLVRVRLGGRLYPCRAGLKTGTVTAEQPVFAPCPGQTAVFYSEEGRVLSSGIIEEQL